MRFFFDTSKKVLSKTTEQLQIINPEVPAVKYDKMGVENTFLCLFKHIQEMIVLVFPIISMS